MTSSTNDFFTQLSESIAGNDLSWPLAKGSFLPGIVYLVTNPNFLVSAEDDIWNIVQTAYKPIGGYKGQTDAHSLAVKSAAAKFVFSPDGQIVAVALYSTYLGSYKNVCAAKNFNLSGSRAAFDLIVKDDIEDYDGWYWCEASGGVEHIFKKLGGIPVLGAFVPEFLRLKKNFVFKPVQDEFHYETYVGSGKFKVNKMIFGLKSKDLAKKVCTAVANYPDFAVRKNVEAAMKKLFPNEAECLVEDLKRLPKEVVWAHAVAVDTAELQGEYGCNEMLPDWEKLMNEAVEILEKFLQTDGIDEKFDKPMLQQNLKDLKWCLEVMTPIEVHQFHV